MTKIGELGNVRVGNFGEPASGDYNNFGFTVTGGPDDTSPWMTLDTRTLPADITAADLGKIISMVLRIRRSVVERSFPDVLQFFTEEPAP